VHTTILVLACCLFLWLQNAFRTIPFYDNQIFAPEGAYFNFCEVISLARDRQRGREKLKDPGRSLSRAVSIFYISAFCLLFLRAAIAMDVPRQMMATYISSTHEPNSIPNCSQMTEKMKSVW
jgi:hypothetical protein